MRLNADRWLALSPFRQVLCWLLSVLLGGLLLWWLILLPLKNGQAQRLSQQATQQNLLREQWRKLRAISPPAHKESDAALRVFTPLDFQGAGRQLTRWQPTQNGGEMMLETEWHAVAGTFPLIAERNMLISAFSLLADERGLHFTLRLEHDNEG
ncbi:hypothetical protein ACUY4R_002862 [Kosakonia sp. BK9b]|uniref:HofO family protein n=1 Tax=Kosakonia sp. TaxID=1916651 RepID=UPI00289671A1|nr:hypothetical protein [Kosakonia sp.]